MKSKILKFVELLLVLMIALSGCSKEKNAGNLTDKQTQTDNDLDVAIVMDSSGSMLNSDPNRIALEAAGMFVDMVTLQDNRLTVYDFSTDVRSSGLVEVKTVESKEKIKSYLEGIDYKLNTYTDTGLSLIHI